MGRPSKKVKRDNKCISVNKSHSPLITRVCGLINVDNFEKKIDKGKLTEFCTLK